MQYIRPRLVGVALSVLAVAQVFGLIVLGDSPQAEAQAERAVARMSEIVVSPAAAEETTTTTTTTTTTVPPINPAATNPASPVFRDEAVATPFPVGLRPSPLDIQNFFVAPPVDSPDDLVPFEPARQYAHQLALARWGEAEWLVLELLLMHESRFDPRAVQKDTGACGIFQALECGKMPRVDWRGQVEWGINTYIPERYGTPSAAWSFWLSKAHPCAPPNPFGFVACGGWY